MESSVNLPAFFPSYNTTKSYLGFIWKESFWFPRGMGWEDMKNVDHIRHPQVGELYLGVLAVIMLQILRYVLENYVFKHIAMFCGLKSAPRAVPDTVLNEFFSKQRNPSNDQIDQLVHEINWTTRKIERWFRLKRKESQCKIKKFSESAWRFFFYTMMCSVGIYVLYDEPWALDTTDSLDLATWPHHHVKTEFVVVYMIELGFYGALLLSLYTDVHRSDFVEQAIHHVATMVLITFSWCANFVRIGLLVLAAHNVSDSWLQMAKMAIYLKHKTLETFFLIMFTISWMYSRVYVFPVYIIYPTIYQANLAIREGRAWPCALVMIGCLCLLQILHLFWTWLIFKTLYNGFKRGSVKDERSEDESENQKED